MTRKTPFVYLAGAAVAALGLLAAAGCSSSGASPSTAPPTTPPPSTAPPSTASGQPVTVGLATTGLGSILVDSQGRTLYLFQKDSGTTSECTGACAAAWPPLRATGTPTVGSGASASLIGTTPRSDGGTQVTYDGHPLYLFIKDQKPGDTNGEGVTAFGASWFALSGTGSQVSPPAPSASTSGSGGGGGY
jgi:predicted lipoprotein with Yx(FWY)xxD motif